MLTNLKEVLLVKIWVDKSKRKYSALSHFFIFSIIYLLVLSTNVFRRDKQESFWVGGSEVEIIMSSDFTFQNFWVQVPTGEFPFGKYCCIAHC